MATLAMDEIHLLLRTDSNRYEEIRIETIAANTAV